MKIEVRKFKENEVGLLTSLWQFYAYHQSTFNGDSVSEKGLFDIDDDYLADVVQGIEDCEAWLICVDNAVAGFVTLESTEIAGREMPELSDIFVLPKYRNLGIATFVIDTLLLNSGNEWHVAVYHEDRSAYSFWLHLFAKLPLKSVEELSPPENDEFHEFVIQNT